VVEHVLKQRLGQVSLGSVLFKVQPRQVDKGAAGAGNHRSLGKECFLLKLLQRHMEANRSEPQEPARRAGRGPGGAGGPGRPQRLLHGARAEGVGAGSDGAGQGAASLASATNSVSSLHETATHSHRGL